MDFALFRKQYDFELEQRNSVVALVNIPLIALTVLGSGTSVMLLDFQYAYSIATYFFCFFSALDLLALLVALYFLCRSVVNYDYMKLPNMIELKSHFDALLNWHRNQGSVPEECKRLATVDFDDYLNNRLAEAAAWNGSINITRGNFLHAALRSAALSVVMLVSAGSIYVCNKAMAGDKIYHVKLVNLSESEKTIGHLARK